MGPNGVRRPVAAPVSTNAEAASAALVMAIVASVVVSSERRRRRAVNDCARWRGSFAGGEVVFMWVPWSMGSIVTRVSRPGPRMLNRIATIPKLRPIGGAN